MFDALALGARHGLDADHLAAISELTAAERGGWRGFGLGAKYALGHAGAVVVLGVVAASAGIEVPDRAIGFTLIALGAWSALRLLAGHTHAHDHVDPETGVRSTHSHRHRHAIGVGVVHGLGGAPSAVLVGGRGGAALAAFALGLLAMNGVVGVVAGLSSRVGALAWLGVAGGTGYGVLLALSG